MDPVRSSFQASPCPAPRLTLQVCVDQISGFELSKLERQNIVQHRKVPGDEEHMRIHLERRKGWTAKISKGDNAEDLRGEMVPWTG